MFMWLLAVWALNYMWRGNLIHLSFGLWRCIWPCCPEETLIKLFTSESRLMASTLPRSLFFVVRSPWRAYCMRVAMVQYTAARKLDISCCDSWQYNVMFWRQASCEPDNFLKIQKMQKTMFGAAASVQYSQLFRIGDEIRQICANTIPYWTFKLQMVLTKEQQCNKSGQK